MEFLQYLLPNSNLLRIDQYDLDPETGRLTLQTSSTQIAAQCPLCGGSTQQIHSHYERTLSDLPCVNFCLTLLVRVSKFFCTNPACRRRIFTERLPEVAAPWSRKTVRLVYRLQEIALALGGAAGARLGTQLGYRCCGSTLLYQLQQLPLPNFEEPKILGVDDFAFRKGCNYGTILVDLERHHPIALLADRRAETLADWLREHPGIEILSRDRSKTYKRGMTEGAPQAIQVADRFHLVQNLSETLELALKGYSTDLKAVERAQYQTVADRLPNTVAVVPQPTAAAKVRQQTRQAHQQRIQHQKTMKALHERGRSQAAIAREVGVSIRTVQRYLSQPDFSDTPPNRSTFGQGILDPYKSQLLDWWNAGIRQPRLLTFLLQREGFTGSQRTVQRYIKGLRTAQGLPPIRIKSLPPLPQVIDPQRPALAPRRAAYLMVLGPENRTPEDTELLQRLTQHPVLAAITALADGFLTLLRQHQAEGLDDWLKQAITSTFKPFQSFATGLLEDYDAVKAGLMLAASNGPVEGLNNRLKMLKRQMFGRAGLDLLEKRFIMAP